MVDNLRKNRAYGIRNPLQKLPSLPVIAQRAPTTTDKNFSIGQTWIDQPRDDSYILTSITNNQANWQVTNASATGSAPITKYVVDPDGSAGFITIQTAIDAANIAGVDTAIYIRSGTYTENLILYDGINLIGMADPIITGSITLDTSAIVDNSYNKLENLKIRPSAGDVISYNTNIGTTDSLEFINCELTVNENARTIFSVDGFPTILLEGTSLLQSLGINGDLIAFPGSAQFLDITAINSNFETNSVIPNAFPTATDVHLILTNCFYQTMIDISVGSSTFTIEANGCNFEWFGLANEPLLECGTNFGSIIILNSRYLNGSGSFSSSSDGSSFFIIKSSLFTNTYTLSTNCKENLYDCSFFAGSNAAMVMSSAQNVFLNNCSITTSNNPAISGAGAGNLVLGEITYSDNALIAGTVNVSNIPRISSGGIKFIEGANATSGIATLVVGTIIVNTTAVTVNSRIQLTHQNNSGTVGFISVSARVASTSFTITSSNVLDTSDIAWLIIEPQ